MSINGNNTVQDPLKKRRVILPRGPAVEERFVVVSHDWFVPVPLLRRLHLAGTENELESIVFPYDESFDSHWQFYLEHQSHPPRIRIGLVLLAPRDRCLRADIKLILITTHGGQVIKESTFYDHTFFLAKGEPTSSFINDHISSKLCFDIEGDLYQDVIAKSKQGTPMNTDDCTILAYVRFINEIEIQPKTKAFDFSRRYTADWKLTKFHQIIEQINQTRPPIGNDRRLVSDRFQFTHVKIIEGVKSKKWRLLIKCPGASPNNKQSPLYLTIKCSDFIHANYGKVEMICKNEHNVLRRYTQSFEDLADNYTMEFFSLEELTTNIYSYRHDFNETNGRFFTIEYLLFSIQIVQPLQRIDVPKSIKRVVEPTMISLNSNGNIQSKGTGHALKSTREQTLSSAMKTEPKRISSTMKTEPKRISPVLKVNDKVKSPDQHGVTRENTTATAVENPITSWDPFSDEPRGNSMFPPIASRNQQTYASPDRMNNSPIRHQPSAELRILPNIQDNILRSPRLFQNKQIRFAAQPRLRSFDRSNQNSTQPPTLSSSSATTTASELPDDFIFLKNLYRSGLHSDVTIRCRDQQWNLHKSILSARSIYFNQYFASSNESELDLSNDDETPPPNILEKLFAFVYTNQYMLLSSPSQTPSPAAEKKRRRSSSTTISATANPSFDTIRLLFFGAVKYGIDVLCLLCLHDMCNTQNLNINTAAVLLVCIHQALTGLYEKYHTNDYLLQVKNLKQVVLRFIQFHSREVLLSPQWKLLEKRYPSLVHDVLAFVVFEKIDE
ncbi:unnamed protein product [Rotaria magnacalcarata]|uniref:BTB domain-containing protein n=1 Tax=Rotaria magnacalcarata TaxID=392030 RepID=A0A816NE66_9BILA|nr:unnamed protein product [Rotaria magnacalcarata]CAF1545572.1 unnamed protein product [Rotaria magnacalcarata]CAF2033179.1 unnamed protein product [Rotaria magnacalcarata]